MRRVLEYVVVLALMTTSVWASESGTIAGTITDARSGEPVSGAAVSTVIHGAQVQCSSGLDGHFVLPNVPSGLYTVHIEARGFHPLDRDSVLVVSDHYCYQDCALAPGGDLAGESDEMPGLVLGAERDRSGSETAIQSDHLQQLPERRVQDILLLQSGVSWIHQNNRIGTNAPELHVRGGSAYDNQWTIDGQNLRDEFTGLMTATISPYAIGELSFWPGGVTPASYGPYGAAAVGLTGTRGGDRLCGFVEAMSDNTLGSGYDQNWYTAGFGGPIPGLNTLRFSGVVERRYLGDRNPSPITSDISVDDSKRLPHNWQKGWSHHGRLDWAIKPGMLLMASANYSFDDWAEYWHLWNHPDFAEQIQHSPRTQDKTFGAGVQFSHSPSDRITYRLAASYSMTERVRGDGVLFDDIEAYQREFPNPEWDEFALLRQGNMVWSSDLDSTIDEGSAADTVVEYVPSYYGTLRKYKTSTMNVKGDLRAKLGSRNELMVGFDYKRHTVRYFENLNATLGFDAGRVIRYGYDSLGNESEGEDWRNGIKHPVDMGAYLQARFESDYVIVRPSLRLDVFDVNAMTLRSLDRPFDPDNTDSATLDLSDLENVDTYGRLSPRLSISVPLLPEFALRASGSIHYTRPPFGLVYTDWNLFEARVGAGSYFAYSLPVAGPERVEDVEIGATVRPTSSVVLDLVLYSRSADRKARLCHVPAFPFAYDLYLGRGESSSRGLEATACLKPSEHANLSMTYSWSRSSTTESLFSSEVRVGWQDGSGIVTADILSAWDRPHRLSACAELSTGRDFEWGRGVLDDITLVAVARIASGTPYTPTRIYDAVPEAYSVQILPEGPPNSSRMPAFYQLDVRLEKRLSVSDISIVPFLVVTNLLDRKNPVDVYYGTGMAEYSGYTKTVEGQSRAGNSDLDEHTGETLGDQWLDRYTTAERNPQNYAGPRQVYFGLRMSF